MTFEVREGDCVALMAAMPACSVGSVVCDPPYLLGFMGKTWDRAGGVTGMSEETRAAQMASGAGWTAKPYAASARPAAPSPGEAKAMQEWHLAWATEALRVLKPGGHLIAAGGSRTYHRLTCAIEDAGFEIRDCITWLYGSGFPKSLDVSKAIDRAALARPLWDDIRQHIRDWRDRAGLTNTELNDALGLRTTGSGMAAHWTRVGANQQAIPTKEMWLALKALLAWPDCELDAVYAAVKDGADRPVLGSRVAGRLAVAPGQGEDRSAVDLDITAPATPEAERWEGWGTALKPAAEFWVVARKPLSGTVAANCLEHGTGALNVDGCRIEGSGWAKQDGASGAGYASDKFMGSMGRGEPTQPDGFRESSAGRWPANVVLDEEAARLLDEQTGELTSGSGQRRPYDRTGEGRNAYGYVESGQGAHDYERDGDSGGASRFMKTVDWKHEEVERRAFYCAKASRSERNAGLDVEHRVVKRVHGGGDDFWGVCLCGWEGSPEDWDRHATGFEETWRGTLSGGTHMQQDERAGQDRTGTTARNTHPTVKPISLMRWLVRLVTPPGGTVLDPFAGSGSTGCAAALEGFDFLGLEREPEYVAIARARIGWWLKHRGDGEAADILAAGEARDEVEATGQLDMFG